MPPAWEEGGNPKFWLGTDDQGRDIYSAVIYGMQISLLIGIAAVVLSVVMGVGLGLLSGYVGGATTLSYEPSGVVFTLTTTLAALTADVI